MSVNNYPYQKNFELYLHQVPLAQITIDEYSATLIDLFEYLSNFNRGYQRDHRVSELFDRDVQQYMNMLVSERNITNTTYNKVLSHLNIYFKYLFTQDLTQKLPTLTLKGKERKTPASVSVKWLNELPVIIADDRIHIYTRLVMLLISKGYNLKEFLQPGFYHEFEQIQWSPSEQEFINKFKAFIGPIQIRQSSSDIFLKQRFAGDPHITIQGIHKYLKPDEQKIGMQLKPSQLFQSYIVDYILKHPRLSDTELSEHLRLDMVSILYYRKLIHNLEH
ncbi:phage integrase N-terminal SAM-like domain-containing protein [Nicoliella spurrieriana]|uniref:Phage integrase N-terminal SAM-like domain-containing protein n=1 Tax=Nicoliella spurrieriana TaxID=2925830 RepID=A0A976RRK7_9LACO|nr:phage integrase N-terminal SAM-like domain-containing protein [Nicoliella spurrieriana]UQS86568.1 phage integrase N-terminal SAM-like domain-containing protein [Nicoliella spurrieriana]